MIHIIGRFLSIKKTGLLNRSTSGPEHEPESGAERRDEPQNEGSLADAERIAATVAEGLEGGDYAAMGAELKTLAPEKPQHLVFEPDGTAGCVFAAAVALLASILFAWLVFVGLATIVLSRSHFSDGLALALLACLGLAANAALILHCVRLLARRKRYSVYLSILRYKKFIFVDDLVRLSNNSASIVLDDLKWAIANKYAPQGHLSEGDLVFMTSSDAYEAYKSNSVAFDRYFQKTLQERTRLEGMTEEAQRALDDGKLYVMKFKNYESLVKDKGLAKKIDGVTRITESIFQEVELNPAGLQSMNAFLNIYLPTIEKLLDAYMGLEEKRAFGENVANTKREIEKALDAATVAFGALLEKLYQEQEDSVAGDVAAMETSMQRESLPTQ